MSGFSNRVYTFLLIFYPFTFLCVHGRGQELFSSCQVGLMVKRGTTWTVAPQQNLTVSCPVETCGESLNVTWCKVLDKCEQLNVTKNIEIRQKQGKGSLTSFLTFKWISVDDDGLYRCYFKGKDIQISHAINISISDSNQGVKNQNENTDELLPVVVDHMSWLPYFLICVCMALLVATLTALALLPFHFQRRKLICNHTKRQETSTHMIPDLPKGSDPSILFLQNHVSFLNDIHSPSTAKRPADRPPLLTGNQLAVANTADIGQASHGAAYAIINHQHSGIIPVREQHAATKQIKNAENSAVSVS